MAGIEKEKSVLFSPNIASLTVDNISSTVLAPPSQEIGLGHTLDQGLQLSDQDCAKSVPDAASFSLQPHLENINLRPSSLDPTSSLSFSSKDVSISNQIAGITSLPPPVTSIPGDSFLRRPTNKYVVPPEIKSSQSLYSPKPPPPSLLPIQSLPPNLTPFTPPNVDYFIPSTNNALGASEAPAVTTSPVQNERSTHVVFESQSPSPSSIIPASFTIMASNPPVHDNVYHPVIHHWFYSDDKPLTWKPFSFADSLNLEDAFRSGYSDKVPTNGGRYDVCVKSRNRCPVYWEGESSEVMRCSWFRKNYSDITPVPYSEEVSDKLEAEYMDAMTTGRWHRQVELPAGERVMLNSPFSMHHYHIQEYAEPPNIANISESQYPQTVRRGADDFEIKDGDAEQVDHLLFLIHGIGSFCDLSFHTVEVCVDNFRAMGEDLLAIHFKDSIEAGKIGRVEILPISWHKALHGDQTGLDKKFKSITLRSIPKLREFTNDTLMDVFLYTSPKYCQHIMDTVASEMDRLLALFRERQPNFKGHISVGGHSLGSVILFDLLMHQNPDKAKGGKSSDAEKTKKASVLSSGPSGSSPGDTRGGSLTSQVDFEIGLAGTGQPAIIYPQLSFQPETFFLMGSPVGMFITVRGIDTLGPTFKLPTCDRVFNIFHPFDPVAYRVETLLDTSFAELRPVLIPHHKGRKRMHLELKDTIERVGSDLKNKIVESIQSTWNRFYHLYTGSDSDAMRAVDVDQVEEEMHTPNHDALPLVPDDVHDVQIGQLNRGLRVDYVLQEKPYESFTEYIFALQAHVTYWNSEDTLLMILKELYKIDGINSDARLQYHQRRHSSETESTSTIQSPRQSSTNRDPVVTSGPTSCSTPPPPVPLFSPTQATSTLPPTGVETEIPRTLRGRPVFDPLKPQITAGGMDPTAPPSAKNLPPPPTTKNVNFSRKKT